MKKTPPGRPRSSRRAKGTARLVVPAPSAPVLRRLANLVAQHAPHDGVFPLAIPGTYALRRARVMAEPVYATLAPSLCIVAQGAKVIMLGKELFEYDHARMLVFAVDLPVAGQLTRASDREPFLGFRLDLDPQRISTLAARVYPAGIPRSLDERGLYVGHATEAIVDAVSRLLDLMAQPEDARLLGPLVIDEILIRLLRSPVGTRVAQIGASKSGVQQVAEAVEWIRTHFAQPVTVREMAAAVHMSASSFHQRFKSVTSMSPLQYQKLLRLHEARRLMLFQDLPAKEASIRVGYLSPSQFSREYARTFGSAPSQDVAKLRDQGFAPKRV